MVEGIRAERDGLARVRERADLIIDTSDMLPSQLREAIRRRFISEGLRESMAVTVTSFGFKYGVPIDADIVMDVRFLPNPFYVPKLRHKTGLDGAVKRFVTEREETRKFLAMWLPLLSDLLPNYLVEGKHHLSIALGCTGGMHRSVDAGRGDRGAHPQARLRRVGAPPRHPQGHGPLMSDTACRAVAIGGGTGLPKVLRCLLDMELETTAVVTMADDGGSSGLLRRELGMLPPGDARNCLVSMAADEGSLLARVFSYRFPHGEGLAGHALGNLIIAALADIEGSFPEALATAGDLLRARGRVLPSTLDDVVLAAEDVTGAKVVGQAKVAESSAPIARVHFATEAPVRRTGRRWTRSRKRAVWSWARARSSPRSSRTSSSPGCRMRCGPPPRA